MPANPSAVSVDPTNPAPTANQAIAGVPATPATVIPGTAMPIPTGQTGIETLTAIAPAFRSNAPKWFTPPNPDSTQSAWSKIGCAVPEAGRYIQTQNVLIASVVQTAGRELFHIAWDYEDRLFDAWPTRKCLWDIYQLLVISRNRLTALTTPDNQDPLRAVHAKPNYEMFLAYPIPFFGQMGTTNTWLHQCYEMIMMMMTECMQHSDNSRSYFYTTDFFNAVYPYIKYLIVSMAVKFFGEDPAKANVDTYTISAAQWAAYAPSINSVSTESTSSRIPLGYLPTDLDLEPIRGLPYSLIVPFLQPWPDSRLLYGSGGIWANPSAPASTGTQPGTPGTASASVSAAASATINPAPLIRPGPGQ